MGLSGQLAMSSIVAGILVLSMLVAYVLINSLVSKEEQTHDDERSQHEEKP